MNKSYNYDHHILLECFKPRILGVPLPMTPKKQNETKIGAAVWEILQTETQTHRHVKLTIPLFFPWG